MDYQHFYDLIIEEIENIMSQDLQHDYHLCKALAACYELQEYLANRIGDQVARGEIEE